MSQWYYVVDDRQVGPVSQQELAELFHSRRLHPSTSVWSQSLTGWVMASTISGLTPIDSDLKPPPIVSTGMYNAQHNYSPHVTYAGFWKRFAAQFIDAIILGIGGFVLGAIAGGFIGLLLGLLGSDINTIQAISGLAGYIIGMVFNWLYFTLFESSERRATPGKRALGIIVTDLNGNRISFAKANGRYWGKILSMLMLFIGYIMAGFTEKKQALHDIISGCLVVDK